MLYLRVDIMLCKESLMCNPYSTGKKKQYLNEKRRKSYVK
jgi:hypothetical protein